MKDQLISYEIAVLAKEKGFDIDCGFQYNENGDCVSTIDDIPFNAPTQSLLQRWLREVHGVIVFLLPVIRPGSINEWGYEISKYEYNHTQSNRFELYEINGTYEEALESALQEALKTIKI
jgi:hypothetical protein